MTLLFLGALAAAIAADVALMVYWRRYNAARVSKNLTPLDARTAIIRIREWMAQETLLDFVQRLLGQDRWRLWLLFLAAGLALTAQNSFPPPGYTLSDQQPLPNPLWKTLLYLEGPLEPYRQAVTLYAIAGIVTIIAFAGESAGSLTWRALNFLPAKGGLPPETAASNSRYNFTLSRWRLSVSMEGPPFPWVGALLTASLMLAALVLAAAVFLIFDRPQSASNPGLALWLLSVFLVLAAASTCDTFNRDPARQSSKLFYLAMGTALVLALISAALLWQGRGAWGMLSWSAGAASLGAGWWSARRPNAPQPAVRLSPSLWLEAAVFLGIIGMAGYFRLARITELAPGINNDAAEAGRLAIYYALGQAPFTPFTDVGWGFESLFIYSIAAWLQIIDSAVLAIRMAAAAMGILTVAAVYLLARRLGGPALAVLSAALLASSGIHIVYSGVGYRLIIQPLFEAITLLFFWRAFDKGRLRDFILGGLFLGLAIHAHNSSRPNPALYAVFVIFLFASAASRRREFIARYALPLAISASAALAAIAPMAGYAAANWGIYNGRANFVFVGHRMKEMEAASPGSYWSPLARNIVVGSLIFNHRGNGNDFFVNEPAFDFPVTVLFVLALAYMLRHWRRPLPFFLLSWFGMGVATGYLSEPNANRTVGAIVPAYVMMSAFLLASVEIAAKALGRRWRTAAAGLIVLLMAAITAKAYNLYVGPNYQYRWGYAEEATAVGDYTNSLRDDYAVYLTTEYWVTDTVRLMTYRPGEDPYTRPYSRFDMALALSGGFPRGRPVAVVLGNWQEELWARDALLERYPGSLLKPIPRLKTPWFTEGPAGYVVIIPADSLDSTTQLRSGLLAKYYRGPDWQGEPYAVFVDPFFSIPIELPLPFRASWEGAIRIDAPGEYVFRLRATNRAQLFIDDARIMSLETFDIGRANERHEAESRIALTPGPHLLRILYHYEAGDREVQLFWTPPESGQARIPFELFIPASSP